MQVTMKGNVAMTVPIRQIVGLFAAVALLIAGALATGAAAQTDEPEATVKLASLCHVLDDEGDIERNYFQLRHEGGDAPVTVQIRKAGQNIGGEVELVEGESANVDVGAEKIDGLTVAVVGGSNTWKGTASTNKTECGQIDFGGLLDDEPAPPDDFACSIDVTGYHYDNDLDFTANQDTADRAHINVDVACVVEYMTGEPVADSDATDSFDDSDELSPTERTAVEYLAERDITKGYPDGTFRGDEPVERQHVASFVWRAVDYADANGAGPVPTDEDALGSELYNDVCPCNPHDSNIGQASESTPPLWQGFTNGSFEPESDVTNSQVHRVVLRWLAAQEPDPTP